MHSTSGMCSGASYCPFIFYSYIIILFLLIYRMLVSVETDTKHQYKIRDFYYIM
jgi:hypothetical protein